MEYMRLWVDDERPAPDDDWYLAVTSADAISRLTAAHMTPVYDLIEVSLDHDLGGDDTGMKVLNYMIEHAIWPRVLTIHTANPPAREQMLRAANAEAPAWVDIYVKHW